MSQVERFVDAVDHERRRNLGIARRSVGTVAGAVAGGAADPPGTVRRAGETAASVGPHAGAGHRAAVRRS